MAGQGNFKIIKRSKAFKQLSITVIIFDQMGRAAIYRIFTSPFRTQRKHTVIMMQYSIFRQEGIWHCNFSSQLYFNSKVSEYVQVYIPGISDFSSCAAEVAENMHT